MWASRPRPPDGRAPARPPPRRRLFDWVAEHILVLSARRMGECSRSSGTGPSGLSSPRRKETRMSHDGSRNELSRRDLIKTGVLVAGAAGTAAVLPARPATAQLKNVARNRTLTLVWIGSREGRWVDFELWNPYAIG